MRSRSVFFVASVLIANLHLSGCATPVSGVDESDSKTNPSTSESCRISDEVYHNAELNYEEGKNLASLGKFEAAVAIFRAGISTLTPLCLPKGVVDHSSQLQVMAEIEAERRNYEESAALYEGVLRRKMGIARPRKLAN